MKLWDYYQQKRPRSYSDNWHLRWMCEQLERAARERRNLVIEAPPRHSKSELCNVYFPAWRLNEIYDEHFMLCTNSDSLAKKFSVATRSFCERELEIDRDTEWKIKGIESLNYSYRASGVRGQMTGHGASVLLFDDLVKNGQEAKSDTVRESIWDGVVSAALNRLSPDGIVVALQSRLHQDDPLGRLLALNHMNWIHLRLPAVNPDGKTAWLRDGENETLFPSYEALWPDRYDAERLEAIRQTVTPYFWNAQYLCVPSMGDLAYFDVTKFGTYQHSNVVRAWVAVDAANTETRSGSYTAFVCLGLTSDGFLQVLGVKRGRWKQDLMHDELLDFYRTMRRTIGFAPECVVVEQAAGGYGLIDHLSGVLPIQPIYPKGSKEDRAGAVCYVVNKGVVQLPVVAPWLQPFVDEIGSFPLCRDKDQADAFVHALGYVLRPSEFKPVPQIVEYDVLQGLELEGTFKSLDEVDRGNW
jgi:predicted phage terminase large subunit-like protein